MLEECVELSAVCDVDPFDIPMIPFGVV